MKNKIDKRSMLFKSKEDAKIRFPNTKLVTGFFGTEGWLWTTEAFARKHASGWHE